MKRNYKQIEYVGKMGELRLYNDPITHTTLALKPEQGIKELITKLEASRIAFGVDYLVFTDMSCPLCGNGYIDAKGTRCYCSSCNVYYNVVIEDYVIIDKTKKEV